MKKLLLFGIIAAIAIVTRLTPCWGADYSETTAKVAVTVPIREALRLADDYLTTTSGAHSNLVVTCAEIERFKDDKRPYWRITYQNRTFGEKPDTLCIRVFLDRSIDREPGK